MEKLKNLLKSKRFWTLVSALVAALSAFFMSSCAASAKVQRHGVHIDTVRVDYIIRSRNIVEPWCCLVMDTSEKFVKDIHAYIAEIQERDNYKAMTDDDLSRLKQVIDDEQVRRRVVVVISDIANSLK